MTLNIEMRVMSHYNSYLISMFKFGLNILIKERFLHVFCLSFVSNVEWKILVNLFCACHRIAIYCLFIQVGYFLYFVHFLTSHPAAVLSCGHILQTRAAHPGTASCCCSVMVMCWCTVVVAGVGVSSHNRLIFLDIIGLFTFSCDLLFLLLLRLL